MSAPHLDQLKPGMSVQLTHTVTERQEDEFIQVSGDRNPLHLDAGFAVEHGFDRRLAHGLLVASLVLPALGRLLPTRGFVCLSQTIKYHAPVGVGETVLVEATLMHVTPSLGIVVVRTTARVSDRLVLSGEIQARLLA